MVIKVKPIGAAILFSALIFGGAIFGFAGGKSTTLADSANIVDESAPATNEELLKNLETKIDEGNYTSAKTYFLLIKSSELNDASLEVFSNLKLRFANEFIQPLIRKIIDSEGDAESKVYLLQKSWEQTRVAGIQASIDELYIENVLEVIEPLPASKINENLQGYKLLHEISPTDDLFFEKMSYYDDKRRDAKLTAVRGYRKDHDKFKGVTYYEHANSPKYINTRTTIYPYIGIQNEEPWLRLKIIYTADDWLFVDKVYVNIDGTTYPLAEGRFERDNSSKIWEWLDITVRDGELMLLTKISQSNNVTLRYSGSQYHEDVNLSLSDRNVIKDVLQAYKKLK